MPATSADEGRLVAPHDGEAAAARASARVRRQQAVSRPSDSSRGGSCAHGRGVAGGGGGEGAITLLTFNS